MPSATFLGETVRRRSREESLVSLESNIRSSSAYALKLIKFRHVALAEQGCKLDNHANSTNLRIPQTALTIVATVRHCTHDRTAAVRSVCNSLQLLLYSTNAPVSRVSSTLRGTEHARESRPVTPRVTVKYRGGKPRGFTVLTARPRTGRAVAGEFNSPREPV